MKVGVGYSENPETKVAGLQAVNEAIKTAGRNTPCDFVLLFSTARHNQQQLRDAVTSVTGAAVPVYGGGAVGVITNDKFGYAGDQVGVACVWLDEANCEVLTDGGLLESEQETGKRLGKELKKLGVMPSSPVMLFYDAVDRSKGNVQLLMATWLLAGVEEGLGFLPDLTGAGMQGDHVCSPTGQYIGDEIGEHYAMALAFSKGIRIDSTIMHGCRPASQYYTVTKAEGPVILEINGVPALEFMDGLLGPGITPDDYPFFLLFGINHGDRWAEYNEDNYASRLCLGIDKERGGIVMFEPDMTEGTEFQLMFRSLDLDYMRPKIEALFDQLDGREPVFAMYIDCAGRCAGYGGTDMEDALVLQEIVGDRVPLLGLYTGVEIASIGGRPRGLDWTGVFCLFTQETSDARSELPRKEILNWETNIQKEQAAEIPLEAVLKLSEQNAAKVLALDTQSIAIRHELEQKRRAFRLLSELSVSLQQTDSHDSLFELVSRRINAALNMQKTAVLVPAGNGAYKAKVLQGYSLEEIMALGEQLIHLPPELLNPEQLVLVNGGDDEARLAEIRKTLCLPYFISTPVMLQNGIAAVLVTGRMSEQPPFLSRLNGSDVETVQSVSALLTSVLVHQRLETEEERARVMLESMPLSCVFWNENGELVDCNEEVVRLFELESKQSFLQHYYGRSPKFQPDGRRSDEAGEKYLLEAFTSGFAKFEWTYLAVNGEPFPTEVTLVRTPRGDNVMVTGYLRDLREQKAAMEEMKKARDLAEENARSKNEFLASVSHEVRTPLNAIMAMARTVSEHDPAGEDQPLVEQGIRATQLLTAIIDSLLDYSQIEAGKIELSRKAFRPQDIVKDVSEMLLDDVDRKALSLHTEAAPDLPETVLGDPVRLEQIIFNIASNAVKFTEKGRIDLRLMKGERAVSGKAELVFEIEDTGIGIDKEQQLHLFEPLTAVDTSYSRKASGLGMGLAISRSLAFLMDGSIAVESQPGTGSIFTVSVLLDLPENGHAVDGEKENRVKELAGLRVLIAEDNLINQMIAKNLLNKVGVETVIVEDGLKVLNILEEEAFDLILMDIQMPVMDGLMATVKIREDRRFDGLPILAMTANAAAEHRAEGLRSGMNDYLTKPVDADKLYETLYYWTKGEGSKK